MRVSTRKVPCFLFVLAAFVIGALALSGGTAFAAQAEDGQGGQAVQAGAGVVSPQASTPWWTLSGDGTLTISAVGSYYNFEMGWESWQAASDSSQRPPWDSKRSQVKKAVIKQGIETIGSYAFDQCANLDSVSIPSSVKTIGEGAFFGCKLSTITIPNGVKRIGNFAFHGCEFTKVTIPASVTSIGGLAFNLYNDRLDAVTFLGNAPAYSLDDNAIMGDAWNHPFTGMKAVAYYPAGNKTWTTAAKEALTGDGKIEWFARNADGTIVKNKNPMTAKAKSNPIVVKYTKLRKANQVLKKAKAFAITNAKGKVTFKKKSGPKKITVSKAGVVTVKKGLKKNTYQVKVAVTAAGNSGYKPITKNVTLKIRVK